jgi:hypothetical protein
MALIYALLEVGTLVPPTLDECWAACGVGAFLYWISAKALDAPYLA